MSFKSIVTTVIAALALLTATVSHAQTAERYLNMHTNAEPESIDPSIGTGNVEFIYMIALFEGLTNYDPKTLEARPGVAEKWTISPDGKTYTFTLRKDAKWSDGTPVTATDFAYANERLLNPKTGSKTANILYPIKNAQAYNEGKITDFKQVGVKVKDPQTIVYELEAPTPYFTYLTSHSASFPVPKQAIEKSGGNWTHPGNIVSNGAFMLTEWTPGKNAVAVKNPKYWNAANVKLAGMRFWPVEDQETALKMYDDGQLDILWYLPTLKTPSVRTRPDYRKAPWLTSSYYWINTSNPQLKDVRVRKALAMAIDRKTLGEQFLYGVHDSLGTFTPKGLPNYTPPSNAVTFDPVQAKKLLAEAGFTDPSTLNIEILYNTHDLHRTVAQVVQQMWKQNLGINATVHNEEWKSYIKDMQQKNFTGACRAGWIGDFPDAMTFLEMVVGNSNQNFSNWKSPQYDALIAQARLEPNVQKRAQEMQAAEKIILDELPLIPLLQQNKDYLIKPYVKGYESNLMDYHPWQPVYMDGAATGTAAPRMPAWSFVKPKVQKS